MSNMGFIVPLVACSFCVSFLLFFSVESERRKGEPSFMSFVFCLHNSVTYLGGQDYKLPHNFGYAILVNIYYFPKRCTKSSSIHLIIWGLWCAVIISAKKDGNIHKLNDANVEIYWSVLYVSMRVWWRSIRNTH